MATTRKVLDIIGFKLEPGKNDGGTPDNWGTATQALGANDALSVTGFEGNGKSESAGDESLEGLALVELPKQVKLHSEGSLNGELRYRGMDKILYWALGYEDGGESPMENCQFTVSGISVAPSVSDEYTNNSSTFTITGLDLTAGAGTIYTERTAGSNDPETSGNLVLSSGSGDDPIAFSATTAVYQSHMFELDARDRAFMPYRSTPNEQTAGDYNANDRKCRAATIGIKRGPNDHRYPNAMCTKIGISSQAGQTSKWSTSFLAYNEERGDYSSSTWTFAAGQAGPAYKVVHHHWTVEVGPPEGLAAIGVSSFNVDIEIPLQAIQDTESGLYLIEPVFNGKYNISGSFVVSRHTADTLLGYRDNFTDLSMSFIATLGGDQFKILIPDIKVTVSDVPDEDVSPINVEFQTGPETNASTAFVAELEGHTIVQDSNILIITNNQNSTNEMRRE